MIITNERVERAKGGGLIIFRTLKKNKNKKVFAKVEEEKKEKINIEEMEFSMSEDEPGEKVDLEEIEKQLKDNQKTEKVEENAVYFRRKKKKKFDKVEDEYKEVEDSKYRIKKVPYDKTKD